MIVVCLIAIVSYPNDHGELCHSQTKASTSPFWTTVALMSCTQVMQGTVSMESDERCIIFMSRRLKWVLTRSCLFYMWCQSDTIYTLKEHSLSSPHLSVALQIYRRKAMVAFANHWVLQCGNWMTNVAPFLCAFVIIVSGKTQKSIR